ncbi:MAG: periplasmic heavy metal sensor [Planctomycetes bacterium]|nr:periplasmic heavy metal sensor [Planctomycetota bacterium]
MLATKWLVPLSLVVVTWVGMTAASAADPMNDSAKALRDTPLGRLITGDIGRLMTLRSDANVTDEQRQKVRAVLTSHKAEIGNVAKDLVAKRRALREATRSETRDEAAIRKAGEDLGRSIGNAAVLGSKVRGELKPVFTDKQIELFKKFVGDHDASVDRWLSDAF